MTHIQLLEDPAFRALVDVFITELPDRISRISEAVQANDLATARLLSHQLKGAGGSYGFESISLSASVVEAMCLKEVTHEELCHAVEQLAKESEAVCCHWKAT